MNHELPESDGSLVGCGNVSRVLAGTARRGRAPANHGPRSKSEPAVEQAADDAEDAATAKSVELFAAMQAKEIDVKFIPKDDHEARVIIKNNTKQPLTVRLPEAFAGVPVLAQRAPGGQNNSMNNMNQGMGGGMGMGMGGMGGAWVAWAVAWAAWAAVAADSSMCPPRRATR